MEVLWKKYNMGTLLASLTDPDGGGGGDWTPPPLKNLNNVGVFSNTSPDPLKDHKATKPAFNIGPPSAPSPFEWRFTGGQMMTRL